MNKSKCQADASTVLNTGEMTTMDDNDGTDVKSDVEAGPDGLASRSDALSGHRDGPGSRKARIRLQTRKNTLMHIEIP